MITSLRLRNYRCFRDAKAQCRPLTILVGENSAGKTSFMAMAKASLKSAFSWPPPRFQYFNTPPFSLGSFEDIVHCPNGKPESDWFEAISTFEVSSGRPRSSNVADFSGMVNYTVRFVKNGIDLLPVKRRFETGNIWAEMSFSMKENINKPKIKFGRGGNKSEVKTALHHDSVPCVLELHDHFSRLLFDAAIIGKVQTGIGKKVPGISKCQNQIADEDAKPINEFLSNLAQNASKASFFASGSIRPEPLRFYDSSSVNSAIPMYLANLSVTCPEQWKKLKSRLEMFGRNSGLFSEIKIEFFRKNDISSPFRLLFRKWSGRDRGGWRNLIDMGFGVSQSLPLLVELLRDDSPNVVFLQQPEVDLHPKAQASFGSLICDLVANGKFIFLETHSDNILDRIRIDVRDKVTKLDYKGVCTLFFEKNGQESNIHTMGYNHIGNITGAPENYREFFVEEMNRDALGRYRRREKRCA